MGHSLDKIVVKNFNLKLIQTVKIANQSLVSLLPKASAVCMDAPVCAHASGRGMRVCSACPAGRSEPRPVG